MEGNVPLGVVLGFAGLFALAASAGDWEWFFNHPRARLFTWLLGRTGARVFYALFGLGFVVFGGLVATGAVQPGSCREPGSAEEAGRGHDQVRRPGRAGPGEPGPSHPTPGVGHVRPAPPRVDPVVRALERLRSGDRFERQRGANALRTVPPDEARRDEVAQALAPLLADGDAHTRRVALETLGGWHTPGVVPAMIQRLGDEDNMVRWAAIEALGRTKDKRAAEALVAYLPDEPSRVSRALQAMGPVAEQAALRGLSYADPRLCAEAVRVLQAIGGKASYDALEPMTRSENSTLRLAARSAVAAIRRRHPELPPPKEPPPPDPVEKALAGLRSGHAGDRRSALAALRGLQPQADRREEVADAIVACLDDADGAGRFLAMEALAKWRTEKTLPAIIARAEDPDTVVRHAALKILAQAASAEAAEAVARRLPKDRLQAADALRRMGSVAEDAVLPYAKHGDRRVCLEAIDILSQIGTKKSIPDLHDLLKHPDRSIRTEAKQAGQAILIREREHK